MADDDLAKIEREIALVSRKGDLFQAQQIADETSRGFALARSRDRDKLERLLQKSKEKASIISALSQERRGKAEAAARSTTAWGAIFAAIAGIAGLMIFGGGIFGVLGKMVSVVPFPLLLGIMLVVLVVWRGK